ncbi:3',5'-nucleoside bisphosphate phosphatase [Glaciimonas soli]|uniref:PHP domain-containing protein n=1 Tax=Glaciimonas soli TaxID=2590999 RepID=A0A843YNF7_9BURK|nr:3',5'-nucleoside bisphosphate phosphatase [Glaciimonas soli]MQQ99313.1 PHP domain-containing protein [Glaciimonas soli]
MLNVDLHSHSNISDGVLSPSVVAARAKANGVDVWALTDHDEVSGVADARAAAKELNLFYVPGVEISITWAAHTIHIVGLRIDETNPTLVQGLAATRGGREQRAREMAAQLAKIGIPDAFEGALLHVGNPDLISRTHFARYLVEIGRCADTHEVFSNYLTEGKPGYVPHRWATLEQAVSWIHGAGGIAVVAHPGRYNLNAVAFNAFFDEFKQYGGDAIEVTTGSHSPDQYAQFAKIANDFGFMASRGSDFHSPSESRIDLGALPPLPKGVVPVWHDWDFSSR